MSDKFDNAFLGIWVGMIVAIVVSLLVWKFSPPVIAVGDCIRDNDYGYKYVVLELGKYGFRARRINMTSSVEFFYNKEYRKSDCFGDK